MPTRTSWLNLVESGFAKLTHQRLRGSVFRSVPERIAAIKHSLACHNANPKPFVRTTSVNSILRKIADCNAIHETRR